MIERKWGRIISLTSSGVEVPIPRLAISNGLRQALIGWSKTLAAEVAADGVTVNIIVQGRIHTDRVDIDCDHSGWPLWASGGTGGRRRLPGQ